MKLVISFIVKEDTTYCPVGTSTGNLFFSKLNSASTMALCMFLRRKDIVKNLTARNSQLYKYLGAMQMNHVMIRFRNS
jgi:hypothetical protein